MEWLDQIVISAGIEAGHPIFRCISRRQDKHRGHASTPSQGVQQRQSVTIGQPEIEDHCVVGREAQVLLGIGNTHDEINGEPRPRQRVAQQEAEVGFVFDGKQTHDTINYTSGDYICLTPAAAKHQVRSE